ncbi:FKBP-like protein [Ascobolus immersus RN42]|uniref:Peptidyl-prolyl cis-trans isomerase n=1 Tax=Ascobolus immersus RN42 TaxID=1160509 RepID=A0A3N4IB73_ASCIM|nr:FKBP-like protein [Ascobolus immersus RN42]
MAPKKDAGKGKGKEASKDSKGGKADKGDAGKLKAANSLNVRHILCSKHSQCMAAIARIDAGEKFDAVAREMSEDKARQGGSLGWKVRGSLHGDFEKLAYDLPVSTCDKPIFNREPLKTSHGYHLIMVEGRK